MGTLLSLGRLSQVLLPFLLLAQSRRPALGSMLYCLGDWEDEPQREVEGRLPV